MENCWEMFCLRKVRCYRSFKHHPIQQTGHPATRIAVSEPGRVSSGRSIIVGARHLKLLEGPYTYRSEGSRISTRNAVSCGVADESGHFMGVNPYKVSWELLVAPLGRTLGG